MMNIVLNYLYVCVHVLNIVVTLNIVDQTLNNHTEYPIKNQTKEIGGRKIYIVGGTVAVVTLIIFIVISCTLLKQRKLNIENELVNPNEPEDQKDALNLVKLSQDPEKLISSRKSLIPEQHAIAINMSQESRRKSLVGHNAELPKIPDFDPRKIKYHDIIAATSNHEIQREKRQDVMQEPQTNRKRLYSDSKINNYQTRRCKGSQEEEPCPQKRVPRQSTSTKTLLTEKSLDLKTDESESMRTSKQIDNGVKAVLAPDVRKPYSAETPDISIQSKHRRPSNIDKISMKSPGRRRSSRSETNPNKSNDTAMRSRSGSTQRRKTPTNI